MCLSPLRCTLDREYNKYLKLTVSYGSPTFNGTGDDYVPCGKCPVCISRRAIEWATRCKHEISLHNQNSFITLTYNDDNLRSEEIVYDDFQKFMKRLRKRYPNNNIRYIVSCEYGTNKKRPHFHAIIFGYNPKNQEYLRTTPKGFKLYKSDELSKLWKKGFHSIGQANEKTAYYIAKYSLSNSKHEIIREESGEIIELCDYMRCSTKPAIGKEYISKYYESILAHSEFTGQPIPRYYLKYLEKTHPIHFSDYKSRVESEPIKSDIQQQYNKITNYISKNQMNPGWDRELKDFTNIQKQLRIKLQIHDEITRNEKLLQQGVDYVKGFFGIRH